MGHTEKENKNRSDRKMLRELERVENKEANQMYTLERERDRKIVIAHTHTHSHRSRERERERRILNTHTHVEPQGKREREREREREWAARDHNRCHRVKKNDPLS